DKPEFEAAETKLNITQWRRENVNMLVREVYQTIKAHDDSILFGISPAGNVDNLRSTSANFVDIDTWVSQDGSVDYIMPQRDWGFEVKTVRGEAAPWAYGSNLKTWIDLKKKGDVELYIGLNVANAGSAVRDNNEVSEWLRYDDILARQVRMARESEEVSGFAFFRHDIFETEAVQKEVKNLISELKQ
ncbi:MAG: family 10 glycosylhydrolase, partial [Firmicutes bacterium]|nr:family 10 glycosylhydrolase [Bacillota bacterium]